MSYLKSWKQQFLSATVYYRQTNNNINRIRTVDATGVATVTFQNLNKVYSVGGELIARNQIFKWWDMTTSFSIAYQYVNGKNVAADYFNSGYNYSGKMSMNFRFWKTASAQISGNYNSAMPIAQGKIKPMWGVDLAIKKDFLPNNRATITISASDIFFSRRFGIEQKTATFQNDSWRRRESRTVTLSFSYRFGREEWQQGKRKNKGNTGGDTGGGEEF